MPTYRHRSLASVNCVSSSREMHVAPAVSQSPTGLQRCSSQRQVTNDVIDNDNQWRHGTT